MAQLLPTFSELRNHITHVLNCCELGDLETQWEDFLLRSIPKKCYPGWRKKTSWYLPLKREKRGNHFWDRDVVSLSSQEGRFSTKETTRISSKDTVQQISCWILKSETDEWLLNSCVKCKRASPARNIPRKQQKTGCLWGWRWQTATVNACGVMLYQELVLKAAKAIDLEVPEPFGGLQGCARKSYGHLPSGSVDLSFHLQGQRLSAELGIGVSRHSARPASAADGGNDDAIRKDVQFAPLQVEQRMPCGATEQGDGGCSSRKVFFIHDETNQRWFLLILSMIDHHHVFRQIVLFVMIFSNHPWPKQIQKM